MTTIDDSASELFEGLEVSMCFILLGKRQIHRRLAYLVGDNDVFGRSLTMSCTGSSSGTVLMIPLVATLL